VNSRPVVNALCSVTPILRTCPMCHIKHTVHISNMKHTCLFGVA